MLAQPAGDDAIGLGETGLPCIHTRTHSRQAQLKAGQRRVVYIKCTHRPAVGVRLGAAGRLARDARLEGAVLVGEAHGVHGLRSGLDQARRRGRLCRSDGAPAINALRKPTDVSGQCRGLHRLHPGAVCKGEGRDLLSGWDP